MNTAWIRSRQTQFGAYATFYIVIVVAALILVNYLANRHNKSIDTTAEKKYSLSDQTEKVVKNLKQDVQITYVDEQTRFTGAKDLLDRYDNLSTRVKVNYLDPDKKPEQARLIGARNLGNIFVQAGGRKEEAKSLTEEEVTGAIIRLFKNEVRTVCSLSGSGEAGLDSSERDGYANAKTVMEGDNFRTKT
ncbi:MAG TPA: Gldg family protein, partial [Bryobacteraceae bacterium]|nr:Gldg family protein [Bryobacteraceae bacterium]